jgi:hypothetical protein
MRFPSARKIAEVLRPTSGKVLATVILFLMVNAAAYFVNGTSYLGEVEDAFSPRIGFPVRFIAIHDWDTGFPYVLKLMPFLESIFVFYLVTILLLFRATPEQTALKASKDAFLIGITIAILWMIIGVASVSFPF